MEPTWDEQYKQLWDDRYKKEEYAYGKAPDAFFEQWLKKFEPGLILMPADGEGRNGVFAATLNWQVTAFDLSAEGKAKALQLAQQRGVNLAYLVGDLEQLAFDEQCFDAIGLIFAHFAAEKKSQFHQKLDRCLKPGGVVIFEAFSKNHLQLTLNNPHIGGPKDINMLFSKEDLVADFKDYEILLLEEEEYILNESIYHNGKGLVIRFVGRKPLPSK
jgi:SAM-dependent methyltransferase